MRKRTGTPSRLRQWRTKDKAVDSLRTNTTMHVGLHMVDLVPRHSQAHARPHYPQDCSMLIRTATPVAGRHLSLSYRHCITITLSCRDTIGAMPTADPSAAVSGNFEVIQYTNMIFKHLTGLVPTSTTAPTCRRGPPLRMARPRSYV